MALVKEAASPKFEVYRDTAGQFRFRLKAQNGEIVLASEGYTAKASCEHGISSVRKKRCERTCNRAGAFALTHGARPCVRHRTLRPHGACTCMLHAVWGLPYML